MVARMQTPLVPVMGTAYIDYWYFFVPNRLVWQNFKEFMGENTRGAWDTNLPQRRIPVIDTNAVGNEIIAGSSAQYLGLPLGKFGPISALPFRGLRLIWNDWFRSTAVDDPLLVNLGDVETAYTVGPKNFDLLPVCKYPDYFTTALPAPQYGEPVSIGLTGMAPVVTSSQVHTQDGSIEPLKLSSVFASDWNDYFNGENAPLKVDLGAGNVVADKDALNLNPLDNGEGVYPVNLYADTSSLGAITINDLRVAFQIQKYKETQARGGSRYVEILESIWTVSSPDARLQRTEYIGGDRSLISMSQVLQTSSSTDSSPQGNASGFSKTALRGGSFTYAVPEHGMVIGVLAVRPIHSYQQGIDRYWKKRDVFDFYNPYLANIGETPVYEYEIYATNGNTGEDPTVFGYQEAWADYRYKRSYVSGKMLSAVQDSLDVYHYADFYDQAPTLSSGWLHEDTTLLDRSLAVSSAVDDQFITDIFVDLVMIRPMPANSIPGLIDHA